MNAVEFNEREVTLMERTFIVTGVILAIVFSLLCVAVMIWSEDAASAGGPAKAKPEPAAAKKHGFVGVAKCGMCHKSDAKGNQLKQWQGSKHSHAYQTLATKEAKEVAEKAGVKGDPQKAPECLKCHVTAFGAAASLLGEKFKMSDGVQCEACHGAGGDYAKVPVMKDRKKAVENGMIIPDEKTCTRCHNESAPGFKGFDFKEMWKKVAHKKPAAPTAKEAPAKPAK